MDDERQVYANEGGLHMAGCVGGGVMLMFEVDTGWDESADLVLNILKAVGVPERSDGQTCSRMRVEDDTLTFLHARALHESLDVISQFDNIVEFRLN